MRFNRKQRKLRITNPTTVSTLNPQKLKKAPRQVIKNKTGYKSYSNLSLSFKDKLHIRLNLPDQLQRQSSSRQRFFHSSL